MYGRRMHEAPLLPYLVAAAIDARTKAGVGRGRVAAAGQVDQDTVRRFEVEPSWKRETDNLIYGYAQVAGREPPDLWREALERWATARAASAGRRPVPPARGALGRGLQGQQPSEQSPDRKDDQDPGQRKNGA